MIKKEHHHVENLNIPSPTSLVNGSDILENQNKNIKVSITDARDC